MPLLLLDFVAHLVCNGIAKLLFLSCIFLGQKRVPGLRQLAEQPFFKVVCESAGFSPDKLFDERDVVLVHGYVQDTRVIVRKRGLFPFLEKL